MRRTILITVLAAAIIAPAAPAAADHAPADEALEYVSLGRAVEHAARRQHAQALLAAQAPSDRDGASPWRTAAVLEGAALGAGSVLLLRSRRPRGVGIQARP